MTKNLVHKALKLRIYPSQDQEILINKTFGCCRLVYNERLQEKVEFYIENILPVKDILTKQEINEIYKKFKRKNLKEIYPFLSEVSSQALSNSEMDLLAAYNNFYRRIKKKQHSGKGFGFPKRKTKKNLHQSYREGMISQDALNFFSKYIKIPKLKTVKFSHSKLPKWYVRKQKLCNITVEKTPSGKYFAVLLFEVLPKKEFITNRQKAIGLDFSPSLLYVDSNGKTGKDFGYIAQKQVNAKKLKQLQRQFAKKKNIKIENSPKTMRSKNKEKARIKLARFEEKIANKRRDFIEKETLRLVKTYEAICIEDLNIKGMQKFIANAKNLTDTSWSTFVARLEQKAFDYDCKVIKADRFYPSSQLCSVCGFQYKELKLSEREWTCKNCGTHHIRDVNAAVNLKLLLERQEFTPVESMEDLIVNALLSAECSKKQEDLQATVYQEDARSLCLA